MLNYIKDSCKITNKYIVLATPLIFFSLLSSLYVLFSLGGNPISIVCALALFVLMLAAFLSGWFYMIKLCVKNPDSENVNALIKEFPSGVGEFFLPILGSLFNIALVSVIVFCASYFIGMKLIGSIGISASSMSGVFESIETLKKFLLSLSDEQLFRLNAWNLLLLGTIMLEYFVILFQFPALFFKSKNPFKAFWLSVKDLFSRNFIKNVFLYLIIFVSYFVLSILSSVFAMNIFTHFIFTLINFYYMVFVAVLLFNYYYVNFAKIGGTLDKEI